MVNNRALSPLSVRNFIQDLGYGYTVWLRVNRHDPHLELVPNGCVKIMVDVATSKTGDGGAAAMVCVRAGYWEGIRGRTRSRSRGIRVY
jgi:hypothetical protein